LHRNLRSCHPARPAELPLASHRDDPSINRYIVHGWERILELSPPLGKVIHVIFM
jgi:hypothetical protein